MAASKKLPKPKPPTSPYVSVDAWTLRCLYHRSDYEARIASGEFSELLREPSPNVYNGSRTIQVYYGLAVGRILMVRLQWFEGENGEILRSGFKDPKQVCVGGFDYHLHGGDSTWERIRREPERALPSVRLRRVY